MSFWGATVITSMVTTFPVAGKYLLEWFWGGYTINNPTLHRICSIHFILPFIIAGLTFSHLALLHKEGSSNPIGSDRSVDDKIFYPFLRVKICLLCRCI
jgi:quinol-cytochrome oxidoreductase complex cytochrome b subunit